MGKAMFVSGYTSLVANTAFPGAPIDRDCSATCCQYIAICLPKGGEILMRLTGLLVVLSISVLALIGKYRINRGLAYMYMDF